MERGNHEHTQKKVGEFMKCCLVWFISRTLRHRTTWGGKNKVWMGKTLRETERGLLMKAECRDYKLESRQLCPGLQGRSSQPSSMSALIMGWNNAFHCRPALWLPKRGVPHQHPPTPHTHTVHLIQRWDYNYTYKLICINILKWCILFFKNRWNIKLLKEWKRH